VQPLSHTLRSESITAASLQLKGGTNGKNK